MKKKMWLYSKGMKVYGPFNSARIAKLVLEGELEPDTKIQSAETGFWQEIGSIKEIADIYHKPSDRPLFSEAEAQRFQGYIKGEKGFENLPEQADRSPIFWNIDAGKLAIYSIVSLGLIALVWFIRQIYYIETHNKRRSSQGWWRYSFYFMFAPFIVFREIENHLEFKRTIRAPFNADFLAVIVILSPLSSSLLSSFRYNFIPLIVDVLMGLVCIYILYYVQRYVNDCNRALGRNVEVI